MMLALFIERFGPWRAFFAQQLVARMPLRQQRIIAQPISEEARVLNKAGNGSAGNGTLRVNLSGDTDSTDPALAQHVVSAQHLFATQAKLMNYPDKKGKEGSSPVPEVAEGYPEISEDGRTYTFRIRSGVDAYMLSTGERVKAEHFAAAINRTLKPEMNSPGSVFVRDLVGAEDVLAGSAESAKGVRILADNKLQLELNHPTPDFLHRLSLHYFGAIPTDLAIDPKGVDLPPSAGPYFVAERQPAKRLVLERNPYYSHSRPRGPEHIVYTIGIDPEEGLRMIENGESDYVADGIPAVAEAGLGARYGVNKGQFMVSPSLQLDYLGLNCSRRLFGDPWVRRAVNFAIDRAAILRARGAYAGVVATHILPPGMPGYKDEHIYPVLSPDIERAKRELPKSFTGGHAMIYTWDTLAGPTIGQIIKNNLEEIGITSEVKELPETTMHILASKRNEPFDLVASGWTAEYPDPYAFLNPLLDGDSIRDEWNANDCYFMDPAYNAKLSAAARCVGAARERVYGDLDVEIMYNAAPMVCCDNRTKRDIVSARIRNAFQHPIMGVDLCALQTSLQ
jgi:peptide/nickel transport system substrate-binding protein